MARRWYLQAKDYPESATEWGNLVTVDISALLPRLGISALRVRKLVIPYLGYNVVPNNATVVLTIDAADYSVTLDSGYYTAATLLAALNAGFAVQLAATTHAFLASFSTSTFLTTILVTTLGVGAPFTLTGTVLAPDTTPNLLTLLGYTPPALVSLTGLEVSPGPLNVVTDRCLFVTCDEARGAHGALESLSATTWHDGIIAIVPLAASVNVGDTVVYVPETDSPWIGLVRGHTGGTISFRLVRNDYQTMGCNQINWVMEIEVRP